MKRPLLLLLLALLAATRAFSEPAAYDDVVRDALAAEARLDTRAALQLFLTADRLRPNQGFIVQKIARQYSDLIVDLPTAAEQKQSALTALEYARRSVALDPTNAENVLSLAVCYGKLAGYSDTRQKVEYSRLIRDEAERSLKLDPNYAWAHHLLGRWNYEVCELGIAARVFVKLFYGGIPSASTAAAVRYLQRAVELEPQQLQHRLELGLALLADGQKAAAREALNAGLAMPSVAKHDEPAKARARAALARIGS